MSEAATAPPRKTAQLINGLMDSTRWDRFELRDDDIIIDTWAKSGTTLTQQIVAQLIFPGDPDVLGNHTSPWLDFQIVPEAAQVAMLEAQTHRRFIKSHLPADCLPWSPTVRYIYIGRDIRDVAWSWHNHRTHMTDFAVAGLAAASGFPPLPPVDPDIRQCYFDFLEEKNISHPFFSQVLSWWERRHEPNVMLVHFADLISDLPGQMRRMAAFLDIAIDETRFEAMIAYCQIAHTRALAEKAGGMEAVFEGGATTFFNKGTNGRWRDVLTPAEIAMADEAAARHLPADCALWLKTGKL